MGLFGADFLALCFWRRNSGTKMCNQMCLVPKWTIGCWHAPRQKLLKYVKANERILHIVRLFHVKKTLKYLRGFAHNDEMHK